MAKSTRKRPLTLKRAAKQFLDARAKKALEEKKLDEAKAVLLRAIHNSADKQTIVVDKWQFKLCEYDQRNFQLNEAMKVLAEETLKPFIKTTTAKKILPTYLGDAGDELAAA